MAIPRDEDIQIGLLHLLANDPAGTIHCEDVYHRLASQFPTLTWEELVIPYRASRGHWANRVQWARWHLVEKRLAPSFISEWSRGLGDFTSWTRVHSKHEVIGGPTSERIGTSRVRTGRD